MATECGHLRSTVRCLAEDQRERQNFVVCFQLYYRQAIWKLEEKCDATSPCSRPQFYL